MFRSAATALSRAPVRGHQAFQRLQAQQRQFVGAKPNQTNAIQRFSMRFHSSDSSATSEIPVQQSRNFSTATAETICPKEEAAKAFTKRSCTSAGETGDMTSNIFKTWAPLLVFNPLSAIIGYYVYKRFQAHEYTIEDEKQAINTNIGQIAAIRDARRESIRDFKLHVWGKDEKEDYDEKSYRRYNHTTLVKTNSFRPGGQEAEAAKMEKEDALKFAKKKSNRIGLYDSEGNAGGSRSETGLDAYKAKAAKQNEEGPVGKLGENTLLS